MRGDGPIPGGPEGGRSKGDITGQQGRRAGHGTRKKSLIFPTTTFVSEIDVFASAQQQRRSFLFPFLYLFLKLVVEVNDWIVLKLNNYSHINTIVKKVK